MHWLIVVHLGAGTLAAGCPEVLLRVTPPGARSAQQQYRASLPPALRLAQQLHSWQLLYREYYAVSGDTRAISIDASDIVRFSEVEFRRLAAQLAAQFNRWLASASFGGAIARIATAIPANAAVLVAVETDTPQLQQLPWHEWEFARGLPQAEVVLSSLEYALPQAPPRDPDMPLRLLATFGDDRGLDLASERQLLATLPATATVLLEQPTAREFRACLAAGWDMLFFAGHSTAGGLHLNGQERVELAALAPVLGAAIASGLKLAIFNACDGLELARALFSLSLPYAIVLREAVPDAVAAAFVKELLAAFSAGMALPMAVRQAREALVALEAYYPCASWLPLLCQHPATEPATWAQWRGAAPVARARVVAAGARKQHRTERAVPPAMLWSALGVTAVMGWQVLNPWELLALLALWRVQRDRQAPGAPTAIGEDAGERPLGHSAQLARVLATRVVNIEAAERLNLGALPNGRQRIVVPVANERGHVRQQSIEVRVDLQRPTVTALTGLPASGPLRRPLQVLEVGFSEAIAPGSFDPDDVLLLRDGQPVTTPRLQIVSVRPDTFRLQNLATATIEPGRYELAIATGGIQDLAGNPGNLEIRAQFLRPVAPLQIEPRGIVADTPPATEPIATPVPNGPSGAAPPAGGEIGDPDGSQIPMGLPPEPTAAPELPPGPDGADGDPFVPVPAGDLADNFVVVGTVAVPEPNGDLQITRQVAVSAMGDPDGSDIPALSALAFVNLAALLEAGSITVAASFGRADFFADAIAASDDLLGEIIGGPIAADTTIFTLGNPFASLGIPEGAMAAHDEVFEVALAALGIDPTGLLPLEAIGLNPAASVEPLAPATDDMFGQAVSIF